MKNAQLCKGCGTEKAKARGLCPKCYGALYRQGKLKVPMGRGRREIEFVKNYNNPKALMFECTMFRLNGHRYTPDFYDCERNVFIELVGTRQAFDQNQKKYELFRKLYPLIKFEILGVDGMPY